jgi:hypothetical protein
MGARTGAYKILVRKPEGRRSLGRPRRRWEDLQEMGRGGGDGMDRSDSGQGQVAGCCEYGNEPSGSMKCGEFPD